MAAKARIGLKKIEMGNVAVDGGMGTSLTEIGATVSDTAVFANEAPNVTDFNIEEQTAPFYSQSTPGKFTVQWSSYNVEPAALVQTMGGTVTTDASGNTVYTAPVDAPNIEQSVKATMKDNTVLSIPRARIDAVLQWNFQKTKLAQVDYTATALQPTKSGTGLFTITTP